MAGSDARKKATVDCPFCGKMNRVDLGRAADRPKCGDCGRPLLMDRPLRATDATFDKIVGASDVPVLVDFYADWCAPCKVMAPILDEIARNWIGRALVLKLDTDRNPVTAGRFNITGIPTLIVFRDGKEARRQVGGVPRNVVESMLA